MPRRISSSSSRLVAAMIRTSTGIGSVAPTGMRLALLEHAQQLHLQRRRHLADLVEEEAPAARRGEEALLVPDGAGEGSLHVPEQLALEQVLRQRAAVDRQERPVGPAGQVVDVPGDDLLAGAALALDQHRRVGRRHVLGELEHLDEALGLPDRPG